jgi:putative solute:sodium symporter small subunit
MADYHDNPERVLNSETHQDQVNQATKAYWKKNTGLIGSLLAVWALVSLVAAIILAEPLYHIKLGGLPLSFWFAQQGSIIFFVLLIFYYSWRMDRLDREYGVEEVRLTRIKPIKNKKEVAG